MLTSEFSDAPTTRTLPSALKLAELPCKSSSPSPSVTAISFHTFPPVFSNVCENPVLTESRDNPSGAPTAIIFPSALMSTEEPNSDSEVPVIEPLIVYELPVDL